MSREGREQTVPKVVALQGGSITTPTSVRGQKVLVPLPQFLGPNASWLVSRLNLKRGSGSTTARVTHNQGAAITSCPCKSEILAPQRSKQAIVLNITEIKRCSWKLRRNKTTHGRVFSKFTRFIFFFGFINKIQF